MADEFELIHRALSRSGPESDPLTWVLDELHRATRKFPFWPNDPLHAAAIIGEELGELNQAILQRMYEPSKNVSIEHVRSEAVQVAAMALRFLHSLDRYDFQPGEQHDSGDM